MLNINVPENRPQTCFHSPCSCSNSRKATNPFRIYIQMIERNETAQALWATPPSRWKETRLKNIRKAIKKISRGKEEEEETKFRSVGCLSRFSFQNLTATSPKWIEWDVLAFEFMLCEHVSLQLAMSHRWVFFLILDLKKCYRVAYSNGE